MTPVIEGAFSFSSPRRGTGRRIGRILAGVRYGWLPALLALAFSASQGLTAEKVTHALNWIGDAQQIGFYVAKEKGWYKELGLDVAIQRGEGSTDSMTKVAGGSADYGVVDLGVLVEGKARGLKLKSVAILLDRSTNVLYTLKGSGIVRPKDLEGRTIGAPAASSLRIVFPSFAAKNGIDEDKVQWVAMSPAAMIPSLVAGKVDSIATFSVIEHVVRGAAQKAGKDIQRILLSDWGVDVYSVGIVTTDERIRAHPKQVKAFVEGSLKGYAWAMENQREAIDLLLKLEPTFSRPAELEKWRLFMEHMHTPTSRTQGLGFMTAEKMAFTRDVILKGLKLRAEIPVEDLYTNAFLPKILPREHSH